MSGSFPDPYPTCWGIFSKRGYQQAIVAPVTMFHDHKMLHPKVLTRKTARTVQLLDEIPVTSCVSSEQPYVYTNNTNDS
ncbi:hypothetical protein PROFUN_06423 [Planoprotostelium fungivorum]|uniref:Uncharacterized protein n=1 Tax=Planoprotostelium fungivorum TaxID=1890364 RepID=A0A2P6NNV5_9EUKA|nr:hypothetical protein PROFUN_06423 [Planoprotostelium fungivorum]